MVSIKSIRDKGIKEYGTLLEKALLEGATYIIKHDLREYDIKGLYPGSFKIDTTEFEKHFKAILKINDYDLFNRKEKNKFITDKILKYLDAEIEDFSKYYTAEVTNDIGCRTFIRLLRLK